MIAYSLDDGRYQTGFAASGREETATGARVPPVGETEIDLEILFGHVRRT
jgi:hypothetical protein